MYPRFSNISMIFLPTNVTTVDDQVECFPESFEEFKGTTISHQLSELQLSVQMTQESKTT